MSQVVDYLRFAIWAVLVTVVCVGIELAVSAARGFVARRALARRLVPAPMIVLRLRRSQVATAEGSHRGGS